MIHIGTELSELLRKNPSLYAQQKITYSFSLSETKDSMGKGKQVDTVSTFDLIKQRSPIFDSIDWEFASQNLSLTEEFVEKNKNEDISWNKTKLGVDWRYIYQNPSMSESFLEKNLGRTTSDFIFLSRNPNLSEDFFSRHESQLDKVSMIELCKRSFSENFFRRNIDKVHWLNLSENSSLSESFFEEFISDVNWYGISSNPVCSEVFFLKYKNRVDWDSLERNPRISEEFIRNNRQTIEVQYERKSFRYMEYPRTNPLFVQS